jgi:hypothetical protein
METPSSLEYLGSANFWERTLQNWQSEFLAVGSLAIFAVYPRQRGSPESKPVRAPQHTTGMEGCWSLPCVRRRRKTSETA